MHPISGVIFVAVSVFRPGTAVFPLAAELGQKVVPAWWEVKKRCSRSLAHGLQILRGAVSDPMRGVQSEASAKMPSFMFKERVASLKKNLLPVGACVPALLIFLVLTLAYIASSAGMHRPSDFYAIDTQGPGPVRLGMEFIFRQAFYILSALSLFWSAFLVCQVWSIRQRYADLIRKRDELERITNEFQERLRGRTGGGSPDSDASIL